jgi:hypothetical protein
MTKIMAGSKSSLVGTSFLCIHVRGILKYLTWLVNSRASSRVVLIGHLHLLGTIGKHIESVNR